MGWNGLGRSIEWQETRHTGLFHIRLDGLGPEKWTVIDLALGAYGSIIDWLERAWPNFFSFSLFSEMGVLLKLVFMNETVFDVTAAGDLHGQIDDDGDEMIRMGNAMIFSTCA